MEDEATFRFGLLVGLLTRDADHERPADPTDRVVEDHLDRVPQSLTLGDLVRLHQPNLIRRPSTA